MCHKKRRIACAAYLILLIVVIVLAFIVSHDLFPCLGSVLLAVAGDSGGGCGPAEVLMYVYHGSFFFFFFSEAPRLRNAPPPKMILIKQKWTLKPLLKPQNNDQ